MKTAIWVVVYFTMCFLLFTGWMFAFAQYAPYNGQEHAFSLTYLLNLFFLHVVGNDSNLLIVFYVQIMPDDFVMQLHRF